MKGFIAATIAILIIMAVPVMAAEGDKEEVSPFKTYIIGPGDVLDISVWRNEDLTRRVTVLPDGKISFPLIGEVRAAGKTLAHLTDELKQKLRRYVTDANLSVVVTQVNSMLVYVIGRVNRPGQFNLNTNITVLQALSMAGGLNPFAKSSQIKIMRGPQPYTKIYKFNYDQVAKGKNLAQNIALKRGDIILVP